jgi:TetR/AcrR family tetracycline transcriptional repressor
MARTAKSPNLTHEAVVEAAARVLEREGRAGLTMRAVAAELKVQAPALYWYVENKEALELALFDHLMAGLTFAPKGVDWRADLRDVSHALRAHLLSYRDLASLPPGGFFFAPRSAGLMEIALGLLLGAGIPPREAFYAFVAAIDYVMGWARGEPEARARPDDRPGFDEAARQTLFDGAYPNMARVAEAFLRPSDIDEQFAFGLDCLIAGFERLIPAS